MKAVVAVVGARHRGRGAADRESARDGEQPPLKPARPAFVGWNDKLCSVL
jgi:hypothetical protein